MQLYAVGDCEFIRQTCFVGTNFKVCLIDVFMDDTVCVKVLWICLLKSFQMLNSFK
jgi:hypothetical protein